MNKHVLDEPQITLDLPRDVGLAGLLLSSHS